jgi:hypothetical protein
MGRCEGKRGSAQGEADANPHQQLLHVNTLTRRVIGLSRSSGFKLDPLTLLVCRNQRIGNLKRQALNGEHQRPKHVRGRDVAVTSLIQYLEENCQLVMGESRHKSLLSRGFSRSSHPDTTLVFIDRN